MGPFIMKIVIALLTILMTLSAAGAQSAPQRVISLDLCLDWMSAAYLPRERVAALSPMQTRYPIEWIDKNWPVHDGSLERVISLNPDLVVVGQYAAFTLRERLNMLGKRVEVFPLPNSLADVIQYEKKFKKVTGLAEGKELVIPQYLSSSNKRQRLLLLGPNGIGTGKGTLEDDILTRAGWVNYVKETGYQPLDLELILADPPDAIVWSAPKHKALANQFAQHAALKKVVPADRWLETEYWRWQCPGPWMWHLVEQLNQWLK